MVLNLGNPASAGREFGAAAASQSAIWTEKYRPSVFEDVVGQEEIVKRVKNLTNSLNIPHMLFAGPAGVGKSTLAIIVAKQLFKDFSIIVNAKAFWHGEPGMVTVVTNIYAGISLAIRCVPQVVSRGKIHKNFCR